MRGVPCSFYLGSTYALTFTFQCIRLWPVGSLSLFERFSLDGLSRTSLPCLSCGPWRRRGARFEQRIIFSSERSQDATSMRFFNCYKSESIDRMIGDRRARNAVEGIIPGASRALPTALLLGALEIKLSCERFSVCISDRKDFYHQFKTTPQRTKTNMCFPPLLASDLVGTSAFASWTFLRSKMGRQKCDRLKHGDFWDRLGLLCGMEEPSQDLFLRACFPSVPQGDALGVEFAVDSHRALMRSHDIINDHTELPADRVFRGLRV